MCVVNAVSSGKNPRRSGILFFVNIVCALSLAVCASTGLAGPDRQAIASADKHVGRLMAGLADIDHPVYLLISSDHGMQRVDAYQAIFLDEFIERDEWRGNHRIVPEGSYAFFTAQING